MKLFFLIFYGFANWGALGAVEAVRFPVDYLESRRHFRESCQRGVSAQGDICTEFKVPSATDPDLTVDYGYFKRQGPRLLVIQSGIHGPEGYAGAAVQELVFTKYLAKFLERGVDVLLIHALNPYGYKNARRSDEGNVNLNRNFTLDETMYAKKNLNYSTLRAMFEPELSVESVFWASLASHVRFLRAFIGGPLGQRAINQGMNSGQFEFPQGLNYGGSAATAQTKWLMDLLRSTFKSHPGEILFLDFHTGLGEDGVLQVMNGLKPAPSFLKRMENWVRALGLDGVRMINANDVNDPDFYTDDGDVVDVVPLLAQNPEKVLALTMEYGTMPKSITGLLKSAGRIVVENQARFHGCSTPEVCAQVKANFTELFNPSRAEWRDKVLSEADAVFSVLAREF